MTGSWRTIPRRELTSELTFLACQVSGSTTAPAARILEGTLFDEEVEGALGSPAPLAGLPRFADCEFETTYPFGRVALADPHFPVQGQGRGVQPLFARRRAGERPTYSRISVTIESVVDEPLECSVMFSLEALVGHALRAEDYRAGHRPSARSGPKRPGLPVV